MKLPGFRFDAVIVDEAAQATEPSSLIPLKYNPRNVILVGDPAQLPATVFSKVAKQAGLGRSLFERLQQAGYPVIMLRRSIECTRTLQTIHPVSSIRESS